MNHPHNHDHTHTHTHKHRHEHSHEHGQNHEHSHTHGHGDNHNHEDDHSQELSFEDKLKTLFTHWIDHNNSHMGSYSSWAAKTEKENLKETTALLHQAAEESKKITQTLEKALQSLKP